MGRQWHSLQQVLIFCYLSLIYHNFPIVNIISRCFTVYKCIWKGCGKVYCTWISNAHFCLLFLLVFSPKDDLLYQWQYCNFVFFFFFKNSHSVSFGILPNWFCVQIFVIFICLFVSLSRHIEFSLVWLALNILRHQCLTKMQTT